VAFCKLEEHGNYSVFLHIMIRNGIKSVDGFFSSCLVILHEVRRNVLEVGCTTAEVGDSC